MWVARPSRLRLGSPPQLRPGIVATIGAVLAGLAAVAVATHPTWDRWVVAAAIGGSLAAVSLERPRTAALVALLGLPFLALLRRLLIPQAPWTSHDPLLAVGPLLAVVILAGLWIRRRPPLAPDLLSKIVLTLLAVALLATFNLNGSGIGAALGGLVFIGLPLLWFFVGRELGDRIAARALLVGTLLVGVVIAVYGLWQTQFGLPNWDARWLAVAGYNSLYVHHGNEYTIRAFGTFSSSAEYTTYVGVAVVIATAFLLHRRWHAALALPVLAVALVFASGRTVLVLTVLAILIMCTLRSSRPRLALSLVGGILVLGVVVLQLAGPSIRDATAKINSPLLSHVAEGLAHPLDPNRSTLVVHWILMRDGIVNSMDRPLGFGTASTNIASSEVRSGAPNRNTEVDVANAFVSLGVVGGLLLLCVIGLAFQRVAGAYRATRDPLLLAAAGILIVSLGQWLNGGHYALAPLIWFLIGYAVAESRRVPARVPPEPAGAGELAAAGRSHG